MTGDWLANRFQKPMWKASMRHSWLGHGRLQAQFWVRVMFADTIAHDRPHPVAERFQLEPFRGGPADRRKRCSGGGALKMNTPSLSMVGLDPTSQSFSLAECHGAFNSLNIPSQASLGRPVKPDHGEIGVQITRLVHCPVRGAEGDETDFHGGGQAHVRRPATHDPANISDEAQRDHLFIRHNPKGLHFERWRRDRGCGKWFHAAHDTVTMEFKAFYGITELPPRELMEQATGEWAEYFKDKLKAGTKSSAISLTAWPKAATASTVRQRRTSVLTASNSRGFAGAHTGLGCHGRWRKTLWPQFQVSPSTGRSRAWVRKIMTWAGVGVMARAMNQICAPRRLNYFDALQVVSQNRWPSLSFDIGSLNSRFSRFIPGGFYYKTFMWPQRFWKHVHEPLIRKTAGLGKAPRDAIPTATIMFMSIATCGLWVEVCGSHRCARRQRQGLRSLADENPHLGGVGDLTAGSSRRDVA